MAIQEGSTHRQEAEEEEEEEEEAAAVAVEDRVCTATPLGAEAFSNVRSDVGEQVASATSSAVGDRVAFVPVEQETLLCLKERDLLDGSGAEGGRVRTADGVGEVEVSDGNPEEGEEEEEDWATASAITAWVRADVAAISCSCLTPF